MNFLKNLTIVFTQYKSILDTAPIENLQSETPVELPIKGTVIIFKHTAEWTKMYNHINDSLNIVQKLCNHLVTCKNEVPCTEFDLITPDIVIIPNLTSIKYNITKIQKNIKLLHEFLNVNFVTKSLVWLDNEAEAIIISLAEEVDKVEPTDHITNQVNKLNNTIFLVIKSLYQKYTMVHETNKDSNEQLQENHLNKLLVGNLFDDVNTLEIFKILRRTHELTKEVFKQRSTKAKNIVSQCVPFLEQLIHLLEYFITQQVSAYRVTCKMTSILLNIFIVLTSKVRSCKYWFHNN